MNFFFIIIIHHCSTFGSIADMLFYACSSCIEKHKAVKMFPVLTVSASSLDQTNAVGEWCRDRKASFSFSHLHHLVYRGTFRKDFTFESLELEMAVPVVVVVVVIQEYSIHVQKLCAIPWLKQQLCGSVGFL